jgi:hypothetical protein
MCNVNLLHFPKKCFIKISEYWILHIPQSPRTPAYFLMPDTIKTEIFLLVLPKCCIRCKSPMLTDNKVSEIYQIKTA